MDYKEKYEQALEYMRTVYPTLTGAAKEDVEHYFPELKESEGDEIRHYLINFVKINDGVNLPPDDAKKAIAWLEKQGGKIDIVNKGYWRGYREGKQEIIDKYSELEKQGEPKPAENKGMNLVEEEMTPFQKKVFFIIDTAIEEEQGLKQVCDELLRLAHDEIMQKPAWSEEDEWKFSDILALLRGGENFHYNTPELFDWLKSLKERYTWKPSDEQMEALDYYANSLCTYCDRQDDLRSLFNDLKKLKGEII